MERQGTEAKRQLRQQVNLLKHAAATLEDLLAIGRANRFRKITKGLQAEIRKLEKQLAVSSRVTPRRRSTGKRSS